MNVPVAVPSQPARSYPATEIAAGPSVEIDAMMVYEYVQVRSWFTPTGAATGLWPGLETARSQLTKVATVGDPVPFCCTVTVGAVPRPDVKSKPVMVIVTTCGMPPGAPAGLGGAVTTVNVGARRAALAGGRPGLWLPCGRRCG